MPFPCELSLFPPFAPVQVGGLFSRAAAATEATWFAAPVWHLFQERSGSCSFFSLCLIFNVLWMIPLCPAWHTDRSCLQLMLKVPPPKSVKPVLKSTSKHSVLGVTFKNFVARFGWLALSCSRGRVTVCASGASQKALLWPFTFRVSVWPYHDTWQCSFLRAFLHRFVLRIVCSELPPALNPWEGRWIGIPLCSVLSSTASLLTPAVAASWARMVSCIYF